LHTGSKISVQDMAAATQVCLKLAARAAKG